MSWQLSCNEQFGAVVVVDTETNATIADLTDCAGAFGERVERARLIAESNELLEALEASVAEFWARHRGISRLHARWCDQFREEHPDHHIVRAEQVIARAKGQA